MMCNKTVDFSHVIVVLFEFNQVMSKRKLSVH